MTRVDLLFVLAIVGVLSIGASLTPASRRGGHSATGMQETIAQAVP